MHFLVQHSTAKGVLQCNSHFCVQQHKTEKYPKYQKFLKNINLLYIKYINDITFAFKMENKNIPKNINMYFFPFEGEGYAIYIFLDHQEDLYLLKTDISGVFHTKM